MMEIGLLLIAIPIKGYQHSRVSLRFSCSIIAFETSMQLQEKLEHRFRMNILAHSSQIIRRKQIQEECLSSSTHVIAP